MDADAPHLAALSTSQQARYGDRTLHPLNRSARLRAERFRAWIGTGKRLLEVGCGHGGLLAVYAAGNQVTGIDADRPALEACRANLGVETLWADLAAPLPIPDRTFDAVVAGEVLEHMLDPAQLLGEIHRVLKPGGLFVGSVPNAYRYRARVAMLCGRPIDTDPLHVRFFSLASLRAALAKRFVVDEIVPIRGKWSHRWPSLLAHNFAWRCHRA
jgi:SAM-dependent methyltransferase